MEKEFKVQGKNTYSLAPMVQNFATTTIAQFIQLQTLCYHYDIAICCSYMRAATCDLLTDLNNLVLAGKLPKRSKEQKGRAYLNKKGMMVFCNAQFKAYPYQKVIGTQDSFSLENIKWVNNLLLQNYKEKLAPETKTLSLMPDQISKENITETMLQAVAKYRMTFDLNRDLRTLYEARNKVFAAIQTQSLITRKEEGKAYIDAENVIRFKTTEAEPPEAPVIQELPKEPEAVYIYSQAAAGKRYVYYGTPEHYEHFECPVRTSRKAYSAQVIKLFTSPVTIYVHKTAAGFIDYDEAFCSDLEKEIHAHLLAHNIKVAIEDASCKAFAEVVKQESAIC